MAADHSTTTKRCIACGEAKLPTDFAWNRRHHFRTRREETCRKCKRSAARYSLRACVLHPETTSKRCTACQQTKPLDDFRKQQEGRFGRSSECKACLIIRKKTYGQTDRGKAAAFETGRKISLRKLYGMTTGEYDAMHLAQGGVCAICGQAETARANKRQTRMLNVDHDHSTGKIRGLLCSLCNASLGGFKDDIELLKAAIGYLRLHKSQNLP